MHGKRKLTPEDEKIRAEIYKLWFGHDCTDGSYGASSGSFSLHFDATGGEGLVFLSQAYAENGSLYGDSQYEESLEHFVARAKASVDEIIAEMAKLKTW